MYCSNCGAELSPDALFCSKCGSKANSNLNDNNSADKSTIMPVKNKKKPIIILVAVICAIVAIYVLLSGISDINHSREVSSIEETANAENPLLRNYYLGYVNSNVCVLKFNDGNLLEFVDCGLGRSIDKRKKDYGTYEVDGQTITITLNSTDPLKCVSPDNGESIIIGDNTFSKVESSKLATETLDAFD